MTFCPFIGGKHDGDHIDVDVNIPVAKVVVRQRYSSIEEMLTNPKLYMEYEIYERQKLWCDKTEFYYYTIQGMSQLTALRKLLGGYNPV